MTRTPLGYIVLLVLVACSVIHMAVYYPALPAKVASHFTLQGQVDGWMGKGAVTTSYAGIVVGSALLMLVLGLALPRLPRSLINLSNKDYWLAPEREKATFSFIAASFTWFGSAVVVLTIVCFHMGFAASLGRTTPAWLFPAAMAVFVAFNLAWCARLTWHFRKPKDT